MVFRLEAKYSYPFIVIFYHYNWCGRLIKFSDIDECARNSHLCSNITVTCKKKIPGDRSGAFINQNSSVMDTIAQVLNRFQSMMPCRVSAKDTKLAKTESMCMVSRYQSEHDSYIMEISCTLFPFSFSIRDHGHKYALSIAFQTLMNVLTIHTTVARRMAIVQTSWDHTTVLVIPDLLEMDTSAKVRSYTACLI